MRKFGLVALWVVLVCVALVVMINIHEIGHVLVARISGDSAASYHLYYSSPNRSCIGCAFVDYNDLTSNDLIAVNAAGVVTTQIVAVLAALTLRYRTNLHKISQRSLIALIGVCLLDAGYQTFQGFKTPIPPNQFPTNVDAADFALLLGAKTNLGSNTVMISLAVLTLAWIVTFLTTARHSMATQPH